MIIKSSGRYGPFAIRWAFLGQFHMVLSTLRWWLPHVVVWGAQSPLVGPGKSSAASAAGDWNILGGELPTARKWVSSPQL